MSGRSSPARCAALADQRQRESHGYRKRASDPAPYRADGAHLRSAGGRADCRGVGPIATLLRRCAGYCAVPTLSLSVKLAAAPWQMA
jgi:hypothetical protein